MILYYLMNLDLRDSITEGNSGSSEKSCKSNKFKTSIFVNTFINEIIADNKSIN